MTREEAIRILNGLKPNTAINENESAYDIGHAICMAIKALEQEPCEDAISRQAVLALATEECETAIIPYKRFVKGVNALPPFNPRPKTGHWIWCGGSHKCSNCEEYTCFSFKKPPRYCPNCGAKMEV